MKISDLTKKQKIWLVGGLLLIGGIGAATEDKPEKSVAAEPVRVLEKWPNNVALLVLDDKQFNEVTAKELAKKQCGDCAVAYFYKTQEAYDLHAYKRTMFTNPDTEFGGDFKKMVRAEEKWKESNGNWNKVKNNLIATVAMDEYSEFPLK